MSGTAVLAYSGGLDTSCAIAWLKEDYRFDEVVAVLVDVGQQTDFEPAFARGRAAGADDVLLVDKRVEFAEEVVARALKANALYEGKYPLISALSRPVIADAVASIALDLGAEAVVHGCTGKGNDQLRFELAFKSRNPGVRVIAPLRDKLWNREDEIAFAEARGIPVEAKQVEALNERAGAYGIGRIDMVENRAVGIKSRELYEAPAALTLIPAHQALEDLVLTRAEGMAKREIELTWAKTVYDGLWFSPLRHALDAFVDTTQELVSGEVRVRLQAGSAVVVGRRSENALYAHALASYGAGDAFPHEASEGFIRLAAMEVELAAARERKLALT